MYYKVLTVFYLIKGRRLYQKLDLARTPGPAFSIEEGMGGGGK